MAKAVDSEASGIRVREAADIRLRMPFSGRGMAEDLDLHAEVSIRLEEAASGCEKQITLRNQDGTTNTLLVKIPAGIESGKSIRLQRQRPYRIKRPPRRSAFEGQCRRKERL